MDLVYWNDRLTDGVGRSGTRYQLAYEPSADNGSRGLWQVLVEGAIVCSVESAEDAIRRSEGLEALRCILAGRIKRLNADHLQKAAFVASEMSEAAEKAAGMETTGSDQNLELSRSLASLLHSSESIRLECGLRQREGDRDALPLLNWGRHYSQ